MQNEKQIIIFSAPSGGGKTTIALHTKEQNNILEFFISATTRKRRGKEVDGKDYYFISQSEFKERIKEKAFIEWEEVYLDQFYGTLKRELERIWSEGKTPIFDIDVKGAMNVKKMYKNRVLTIFVAPPSLSIEVLEERLRKRGTESEKKIKERIAKAKKELPYADKFDKILINDILEESFKQAEQLVSDFLKEN